MYHSPLQRHIQSVFDQGSTPSPHAQTPVPLRHEYRHHETHRGPGLGLGLNDIVSNADLLTRSNSNARTQRNAFQPQKRSKGTNSWQLKQFAEATLGSGSLRKVVQLPEGEDRDEWLAVNGEHEVQRCSRANILIVFSGRLLQPDQPPLWSHHRVLLPTILPGDEGNRRVRVPMARSTRLPKADTPSSANLHLAPSLVDLKPPLQRIGLPNPPRSCLPTQLPANDSHHLQATIPNLRPHLLPPLWCDSWLGIGGTFEHRL